MRSDRPRRALLLGGGGARGAYQTGAVKAIGEIARELGETRPFTLFSGLSAGAVNAAYLASRSGSLGRGARDLVNFWSTLQSEQVFRIDAGSLSRIGFDWALDLVLGGLKKKVAVKALLDTTPLRELLAKVLDMDKIRSAIASGLLEGVAITAASYATQKSITFVETEEPDGFSDVLEGRRILRRTRLLRDHVMASTAIPIFFPPILIEGEYFGDGAMKNAAPLSPAIRMGATSICILGVHRTAIEPTLSPAARPTAARILGTLLDTLFLDALDTDVERLEHVNRILEVTPRSRDRGHEQRIIPHLYLLPSEDLSLIALRHAKSAPRTIRYLMRGLGSEEESAVLLSYLLFEGEHCGSLADLGYRDAWDRKDKIREFLEAGAATVSLDPRRIRA